MVINPSKIGLVFWLLVTTIGSSFLKPLKNGNDCHFGHYLAIRYPQRVSDYTPEKYRDALVQILSGPKGHPQHGQIFWYQNFFANDFEPIKYLEETIVSLIPLNIMIGDPDILPHRIGLQKYSSTPKWDGPSNRSRHDSTASPPERYNHETPKVPLKGLHYETT